MATRKDLETLLGAVAEHLSGRIADGEATAAELTVAVNLCKGQNIMIQGAQGAELADVLADVDEGDMPEAHKHYRN